MSDRRRPLVLAILDGWGVRTNPHGNAIAAAALPIWSRILAHYPHAELDASGESVGLPAGVMGNSEVGHINIGSGRVVPQGLVVIDDADRRRDLRDERDACRHASRTSTARRSTLHLFGLLSDGKVHSSLDHLEALIDAAVAAGVPLAIDAFLDGRDTPPRSAQNYVDAPRSAISPRTAAPARSRRSADATTRWTATSAGSGRARRTRCSPRGRRRHRAASAARSDRSGLCARRERRVRAADDRRRAAPRPRRRRGDLLQLPPRSRPRNSRSRSRTPRSRTSPCTRYADLMFATMTRYEDEFPNPVLFGPRPQTPNLRRDRRRRGLGPIAARRNREVRPRHLLLQRRARRGVRQRRSRLDPVEPGRCNLRSGTGDGGRRHHERGGRRRGAGTSRRDRHELRERRHGRAHRRVGRDDLRPRDARPVPGAARARGARPPAGSSRSRPTTATPKRNSMPTATCSPRTRPIPVPFVLVSDPPLGTLRAGGKLGDIAPTLLPLLGLAAPPEMTGTNLLVPARLPA